MKILKTIHLILLFSITFTVSAQDYPFTVAVEGAGQPILLFPGFTSTDMVWEETVAELSNHYECHVFTFAGFGGVAPAEKPWLPKIKSGIEQYVKNKDLKNPMVIGHSLGGALGLWLAIEEEHPFSRIIVVTPCHLPEHL